jgi:hypothetical protein
MLSGEFHCHKVPGRLGLRGDLDYFDVTSLNNPANSGTSTSFLPSPKMSLIFGPWEQTEIYVQGGFGFHSNDGGGTTQTVEPVSAENPVPGTPAKKIPGLIQTKGAEIGVRTPALPHWQSTLSLWYLRSDSELQQAGDTGGTTASKQPSDRYGIEWANYFALTKHMALDFDCADSIARFTSVDAADAAPGSPGGNRVPESVGLVISLIVRGDNPHLINISARIGHRRLTNYRCDGLIVATPTGSTAYSLAAGGPIISPECRVLTITPICPQSLTNRSVVINSTELVEMKLDATSGPGIVQVDGMTIAQATPESVIRVQTSHDSVPIAFLPEINYYDVLGEKLKWAGDGLSKPKYGYA